MANARKNAEIWDQVLDEATAQGLVVERPGDRRNGDGSKKKSKHIRITHPTTGDFVIVANTPSDYRAILNNISWMRRELGFVWKGRGSSVRQDQTIVEEISDQPARPAGARPERTQRHARSRRRA